MGDEERIILKAVDLVDLVEIHFRLKTETALVKLKQKYAECTGMPVKSLCFLSNNRRIDDADTPTSLGLVDGDVIEVLQKIRLLIVCPGQNDVHVRIKYGAPMLSLKKTFSAHLGFDMNTLTFVSNGRRIKDEDSPYSLQLANHDIIQVAT